MQTFHPWYTMPGVSQHNDTDRYTRRLTCQILYKRKEDGKVFYVIEVEFVDG